MIAGLPLILFRLRTQSPTAPLRANASVIAILHGNQMPRVQQWNLQVEQQLGGDTSLDVAYAGSRSDHLMTWFNLNNQMLNAPSGTMLYPGTGLTVNLGTAAGVADYNALEIHLSQRFARNMQYTVSYACSHTLDNSNGPFSVTGGNARIFILPGQGADLAANYGNSDQDQRHFLTLSTLYELPFGHGKLFGGGWNGFLNSICGRVAMEQYYYSRHGHAF